MTDQKQFSLPRHKLFKLTATSSPLMLMPVMIRTVCLIVMVVLGSGPTAAQSNVGTLKVAYSEAKGIGPQKGVMRRDPSDIIKVDDLYYLWYSKGKIGPGYDATVWYATSPDGRNWTEKGMALAKGQPGSWEGESVFTPNILVAEGRYWLFYTGVSKKFGKKYNPDSKIGIAVSDSPNGPWERLATNPALKNSDQPEFLPTRQGFDEYFGIPYSHDIHPFHGQQKKYNFPSLPLLEGETVVEMDPDADYLTKRITERAVRFIKENKDAPFFLYVPHPIPHRPLSMSPPFIKDVPKPLKAKLALEKQNNTIDYKTRDKLLRQAIAEIDWSVGQILDTLKAQGIDENTFVIFTSDNGPSLPGKATPLSGKKGSTLEGGMREPTVIR
jgi:hypothetical protein